MPVENTTPSVNKLESYHLKANGTISIFEVTDDTPLFVDGIRGKALQMHESYKDAVRFANAENISSKQFSVLFWVKTFAGDDFSYGRIISHADTIGKSGWFLDVKNSPENSTQLLSCRTPVYNIGHRNIYGIAFDYNNNGFGIVTEAAHTTYDKISDVRQGR
jgi:hypothetical protein